MLGRKRDESRQDGLGQDPAPQLPDWAASIGQLPQLLGGRPDHECQEIMRLCDLFRRAEGDELQRVLVDYRAAAPRDYYATLYRDAFLGVRGPLPTDPATQVIAYAFDVGSSAVAHDIPHLCGAIIGALLEVRAGVLAEADDEAAGIQKRQLAETFTLVRRIGAECDELLPLRRGSEHVVLAVGRRLLRIDLGGLRGGNAAAAVAASVARALASNVEGVEANLLPALTGVDKRVAAALRAGCDAEPQLASALRTIESALCVLAISDSDAQGPGPLHEATVFGRGFDRWYGQMNLVVHDSGTAGILLDHAVADGEAAVRLGLAVKEAALRTRAAMPFAAQRDGPSPAELDAPRAGLRTQLLAAVDVARQAASSCGVAHRHVSLRERIDRPRVGLARLSVAVQLALMRAGTEVLGHETDAYTPVALDDRVGGRVGGVRARPPATSRLMRGWQALTEVPRWDDVTAAVREWPELFRHAASGRDLYRHLRMMSWMAVRSGRGEWFFNEPLIREFLGWPPVVSAGTLFLPSPGAAFAFPSPRDGLSLSCLVGRDEQGMPASLELFSMGGKDPEAGVEAVGLALGGLLATRHAGAVA